MTWETLAVEEQNLQACVAAVGEDKKRSGGDLPPVAR